MSTPAGGGGGGGGGGLIGAAVAVVLVLFLLNTGQCTFTLGGNSPRAPVAYAPTVPRASYAPTVRSRGTLEDEINRALGRPQLEPGVGYSVSTTRSPYVAPKSDCQVLGSALSADGMYTFVRRACPRYR